MLNATTKQKNIKNGPTKGFVRIIGGKWRGRKLDVINQPGLRPTGDRMRETLFNWLMHDITNSHCLDLFAGSGSLGFEAASRGALSVTLIENNKATFSLLNHNIQTLKTDNITTRHQDAFEFIKSTPKHPYDIIFLDPPFNQGMLQHLLFDLSVNGFIASNGVIYVESEKNTPLEKPDTLELIKEKISGQVLYQLLRRID